MLKICEINENQNGFGGIVEPSSKQEKNLPDFTKSLRKALSSRSFLIFRGFNVNDTNFESWTKKIGEPIKYSFGELLVMEVKKDTNQSQFTEHSMPFHQDTVINDSEKAHLLAFMCVEAPAYSYGGETLLSNNRAVVSSLSLEDKNFLLNSKISYKALHSSYYKGDGLCVQSPIVKHPLLGVETFFLALDDYNDLNRNYEAKFLNTDISFSRQWMDKINTYLNQPSMYYTHHWLPGDIIVLDNYLVCHARNEFKKGAKRKLLRFALKVDENFYD